MLPDIDQTYKDSERLIYNICWKFHRQCRTDFDFDELVSIANMVFVSAYRRFEQREGENHWGNFLSLCIWRRLKQRNQFFRRRKNILKHLGFNPTDLFENTSHYWECLSEDADFLVQTILSIPNPLEALLSKTKNRTKRDYRRCLKEFLQNVGWETRRIENAFQELCEVVKEASST